MKKTFGRIEPRYMPTEFQVNQPQNEGRTQDLICWEEGRNSKCLPPGDLFNRTYHEIIKLWLTNA